MRTVFLFLLLSALPLAGGAYTFKKYHVNNGLSENTVQVITQDHRGFMWFGTKDGLNRFDGHEYQIYRNIPGDPTSLGNNFVRSIYQDERHNLWIGTDNRIYIFDYVSERFHPFAVKTDRGVAINSGVTAICPENDSLLWIGTLRQGAFCYNKNNGHLKHYPAGKTAGMLQSNVVWRIYRDYSGTLWLGTREGLSRYNRETDTFHTYTTQNTQGTLPNDDILAIYEDHDGTLWVGTWAGGAAKLNKATGTFDAYLNAASPPFVSHIRALAAYDKSTLMVGADDGLYLLNKKTGQSARMDNPKDPNSLSDQNVYSIFRDHENGVWIGTYFGGVNYMSSNANIIEHYYPNAAEHALAGKAISQFCEDEKGNLWIATEDAGLNYFDTQTGRFTNYRPQKEKTALAITTCTHWCSTITDCGSAHFPEASTCSTEKPDDSKTTPTTKTTPHPSTTYACLPFTKTAETISMWELPTDSADTTGEMTDSSAFRKSPPSFTTYARTATDTSGLHLTPTVLSDSTTKPDDGKTTHTHPETPKELPSTN